MKGTCSKGADCNYYHPPGCRFFKEGKCTAGNKCPFRHYDKKSANAAAPPSPKAKAKTKAKAKKGKEAATVTQEEGEHPGIICIICEEQGAPNECKRCGRKVCNRTTCWNTAGICQWCGEWKTEWAEVATQVPSSSWQQLNRQGNPSV